MNVKVIAILTIVLCVTPISVFSAGGKVTIHNARYLVSMKYLSNNKTYTVDFSSQNEGGTCRLKGKRNFQVIAVTINENGKEKECTCVDDALFRWRSRHPVDLSYNNDGSIEITGTFDRKFKKIQCPCK